MDGLPPGLRCLGLLDGVELLLLEREGEAIGLIDLVPCELLLLLRLGLASAFSTEGGPISVELTHTILFGLSPLLGDDVLSSSRRLLRSFFSASLLCPSPERRNSLYLLLFSLGALVPTGVIVSELGILDEDGSFPPNGIISMPGRHSRVILW